MRQAQRLYEQMRQDNFTCVITTMMREDPSLTEEHAEYTLDAFLQWFSLIPLLEDGDVIQMLESVDPAWHAMILNTRWYREFCERHIGHFVDHDATDPLDTEAPKAQYAKTTLRLLYQEFGEGNVHPELMDLTQQCTCCFFKPPKSACAHEQLPPDSEDISFYGGLQAV